MKNPNELFGQPQISYHSIGCLFTLLIVFLAVQKLFSLIQPHLSIFTFVTYVFGITSKKLFPRPMSRSIFPMFFPSSFMVSGLTLKSLINILSWFTFVHAYLRDNAGSVPDDHNKANIAINKATQIFCFPSAHESYATLYYGLLSVQQHYV